MADLCPTCGSLPRDYDIEIVADGLGVGDIAEFIRRLNEDRDG